MRTRSFIFGLLASAVPFFATAAPVLTFPDGSVRGYEQTDPASDVRLAIGPYANGKIDMTDVTGTVQREVWKIPASQAKTLVLIKSLRKQLEAKGYKVLYQCATRACGGFDFRFNAGILDEPEMHVDLGNFRYLSASKPDNGKADYISLLVSRSPDHGFVQVTQAGNGLDLKQDISMSTKQSSPAIGLAEVGNLSGQLTGYGAAVLDGLQFLKGSASLSGNPAESLGELAAFLGANPDLKVVLVGHTDASGSLDGNISLSRKRAQSVLKRLVDTYGVNKTQLRAEGVGYLSPRATNSTNEGRDKNRRVEVVLAAIK